MLVKAIRLGYMGIKRIHPGTMFRLKDEKQFSSKWMEKVNEEDSFDDESEDDSVEIVQPRARKKPRKLKSKEEIIEASMSATGDEDVI